MKKSVIGLILFLSGIAGNLFLIFIANSMGQKRAQLIFDQGSTPLSRIISTHSQIDSSLNIMNSLESSGVMPIFVASSVILAIGLIIILYSVFCKGVK